MPAPTPRPPPLVSIGMPIYNAGATLDASLRRLRAQTWTRLEIILSDNASSDGTAAICARHASEDPRIRFVRQERNLGAAANFEFVMRQAAGDYFMWAAHDDRWSTDFVARNCDFLERNPGHVGSITRARREGPACSALLAGSRALEHPWRHLNICRFVAWPGANARFYSLFRTSAVRAVDFRCFPRIAGDWSFMVEMLAQGKLHTLDGPIGFLKGGGGTSASPAYLYRARTIWIERFVPFYHFLGTVWRHHALLPCLPLLFLHHVKLIAACWLWRLRRLRQPPAAGSGT